MKITTRKAVLLGSALLGICTTVGVSTPAQAAPRDDNSRQSRHDDDNQNRQDEKGVEGGNRNRDRNDRDGDRNEHNGPRGERLGNRGPGNRGQGRGPRGQGQGGRYNDDDNQRGNRPPGARPNRQNGRGDYQNREDGKFGDRGRRNADNDYPNRGGNYGSGNYGNGGGYFPGRQGDYPQNNRPSSRLPRGNRGPANGGYNPNSGSNSNGGYIPNGGRTYTGTVTRMRSNTNFDVDINGNTFNVYLDTPAPRGLVKGDTVRISGVQQDKNDIRNATVSMLRNR